MEEGQAGPPSGDEVGHESIGARLRHIRGHSSQGEFAKSLGIAARTYANYERGDRDMSVLVARQLAERGWNPLWILTGQGAERLENATQHERDAYTIAQGDPSSPEVRAAHRRRDQAVEDWSDGLRQGLSQPMRLDQGTLAEALEIVDRALVLRRRKATTAERARLTALAYDILQQESSVSAALSRIMATIQGDIDEPTE